MAFRGAGSSAPCLAPSSGLLIGMAIVLLLSMAAVLAVASRAQAAYHESYECGTCAEKNGPEATLSEAYGWNLSGKGVCSALWERIGSEWYENLSCTESGEETCAWEVAEVEGHGQVRRWYAKYEYTLLGLETDYLEDCDG